MLSSKDKSSLWHIQSAFTQGLKSYIYNTKMFKLTLQHPSSEKLIVLFVQQQKLLIFLITGACLCTHTYPHPYKYVCIQEHLHSEEYVKTYVSGNTKHSNIAAVCTHIILSFLMSSLCNECCRCSAETYDDIMLLKAVSQYAQRVNWIMATQPNLANHYFQELGFPVSIISF